MENDVCSLLFLKPLHLLIINELYFFQQRNDKEECLVDSPKEIVTQNQFILNLLHQFGDSGATNEKELENINFRLIGKEVCEDCLCIIYSMSDWRYQRIKKLYRVNNIYFLQ